MLAFINNLIVTSRKYDQSTRVGSKKDSVSHIHHYYKRLQDVKKYLIIVEGGVLLHLTFPKYFFALFRIA